MTVSSKTDPFFQMVQRKQVILPLLVHNLKHHQALKKPHRIGANLSLFFLFVALADALQHFLFQFRA